MSPARKAIVVLLLLVSLIIVVVVVRSAPDVMPESDLAVTDVAVLHVLHGEQFVGPYSRFGWYHPGPMYFQVLAPLYWLSNYRHLGVVVTVALLNVACLIAVAAIFRRHLAAAYALPAVLAIWIVYVLRMDPVLASPWNPHVPLLPLALLFVASAAVVAGRTRLFPLVAILATFVSQTHVTFLPLAAVATLAATVAITIRLMRVERKSDHWRWASGTPRDLIVAAAAAAVLWAAPLFAEFRSGSGGNLKKVASFAVAADPVDPRGAARAVEYLMAAPFSPGLSLDWGRAWSPRERPRTRYLVALQAFALPAAMVIWWRRRHTFEASLAAIVILATLVALIGARRLPEPVKDYTVLSVSILGTLTWCLLGVFLLQLLGRVASAGRAGPVLLRKFGMVLFVGGVSTAAMIQVWQRHHQDSTASARVRDLTTAIRRELGGSGTTRPLVQVPSAWGVAAGIILELYRTGIQPAVDSESSFMFGAPLRARGDETPTFAIGSKSEHEANYALRSNYRSLGEFHGLVLYVIEPAPPFVVDSSRPMIEPLTRLRAGSVPALLFDGRYREGGDDVLSPEVVIFGGDSDRLIFRAPDGTVGLRLWGQELTRWRIGCPARGDVAVALVEIRSGLGAQSGEVFSAQLSGCPAISVSRIGGDVGWLSEVEVLTRPVVTRDPFRGV